MSLGTRTAPRAGQVRCNACAERIDLFMRTWDHCVLAGFLERSSAAQACSAEFVCFCTCNLQTRQRDQTVAGRVVKSIGHQGCFPICAGAAGRVAIASSVRTRRHAAPRSRFEQKLGDGLGPAAGDRPGGCSCLEARDQRTACPNRCAYKLYVVPRSLSVKRTDVCT